MKPVPNAKEGTETLESLLVDVLSAHHEFNHVIIELESTGFYGVHIANYLSASNLLSPFGTEVYCLNPKEVAKYKESFNVIYKNDGIDSFVIADFARVGRITIKPWHGTQYPALQRFTRHRLHIAECIAREKTYVLNNILFKLSEFAMLKNENHQFNNKYGATAQAILEQYITNEDIIRASIEELVELIESKSPYRLDKVVAKPITLSINSSFNCIRAFEKELKAIEKTIEQTVKGINPVEYQVLKSISIIGHTYATGILAEIGTLKAFSNNDALAKYCGIIWKENQSGNFHAEDTKISKAGNLYLRYYVIKATGSVIDHCPEYKAFYGKKFAETTTHQHKRALELTSRKFLRMLFEPLDKRQLYSLEKSR